jgi:hypothetical protein
MGLACWVALPCVLHARSMVEAASEDALLLWQTGALI